MGSAFSSANTPAPSVKDTPQASDVVFVNAATSQAVDHGRDSNSVSGLTRAEAAALSKRYKEAAFARVGAKAGFSAALGTLFSPLVCTGSLPIVAVAGALNSAAFVTFYDVTREALTSVTLVDTPLISAFSGGLAGYVWNGLVHQQRHKAVAGAAAIGLLAAASHAAWPAFEADKAALSLALSLGLLVDHDGELTARAAAPPVLPPFDARGLRAALFRALPVREVADDDYERMQELNPPMTISFRGKPEDTDMSGKAASGLSGQSSEKSRT